MKFHHHLGLHKVNGHLLDILGYKSNEAFNVILSTRRE